MYRTTVDLELRQAPDDAAALACSEGLVLSVGSVHESSVVRDFSTSCGGADVGAALELALPKMQLGEESELRCTAQGLGGAGFCLRVKLVSWVVVEPLPHTQQQVIRRVVTDAGKGIHERPSPLSSVDVRYVVRPKGSSEVIESSGDEPFTFIVSEAGVLPCIDLGVREMKRGEKSIIVAPTQWAYTSPVYVPPSESSVPAGAAERTLEGVEVELELLGWTRGKDYFQLSPDEKMVEMAKYREAGNRLFKAGDGFIKLCEPRPPARCLQHVPCARARRTSPHAR